MRNHIRCAGIVMRLSDVVAVMYYEDFEIVEVKMFTWDNSNDIILIGRKNPSCKPTYQLRFPQGVVFPVYEELL